jgi:hypothetical protein
MLDVLYTMFAKLFPQHQERKDCSGTRLLSRPNLRSWRRILLSVAMIESRHQSSGGGAYKTASLKYKSGERTVTRDQILEGMKKFDEDYRGQLRKQPKMRVSTNSCSEPYLYAFFGPPTNSLKYSHGRNTGTAEAPART